MTELIRGIDVSHHQPPSSVKWAELAKTHKYVIVRACYSTVIDERFAEHIKRARDVGLTVGSYLFYRPGDSVQDQLDTFASVVEPLIDGTWLLPAIDVEQDSHDGPISSARYAPAEEICRAWRSKYGSALIYSNPATWAAIGSPGWIREYPLWWSHYGVQSPHTPFGLPWVIWQHKVAPLPGVFSGPIDQNVARELPLISAYANTEPAPAPSLIPVEVDWTEINTARDELIEDKD